MAPKFLPSPQPQNLQGLHPSQLGGYNNPSPSGNAGPRCFSTGPPPSGHPRNVGPEQSRAGREAAVEEFPHLAGPGTSSAQCWDRWGPSGKGRLGHLSVLVGSPSPCSPTGTLGIQPDLCQTLWTAQAYMWHCDLDPYKGNPCGVSGSPTCPPDAPGNNTNMVSTPRPIPCAAPWPLQTWTTDLTDTPTPPWLQVGGYDLISSSRTGPCIVSGSPVQLPDASGNNNNVILPSRPFCL